MNNPFLKLFPKKIDAPKPAPAPVVSEGYSGVVSGWTGYSGTMGYTGSGFSGIAAPGSGFSGVPLVPICPCCQGTQIVARPGEGAKIEYYCSRCNAKLVRANDSIHWVQIPSEPEKPAEPVPEPEKATPPHYRKIIWEKPEEDFKSKDKSPDSQNLNDSSSL